MAKRAVCMLLLACIVGAQAVVDVPQIVRLPLQRFPVPVPRNRGSINFTVGAGNVVGGNLGSSSNSACSGAIVSSSGNGGGMATGSSSASSFLQPAAACSNSIIEIFNSAAAGCGQAEVTTEIYLAATACAASAMELRVESVAKAQSWGRNSQAISFACSNAAAQSSAYATAMARAVTEVMADANGRRCTAAANITSEPKVKAVAAVMLDGFAASWATARTVGNGRAKAVATAFYKADVQVYAQAIAELFGWACGACTYRCGWCAEFDGGVLSSSGVAFTLASGRFSAAQLFSDAQADVCYGRRTAAVAARSVLSTYVDVCVDVISQASANITARGRNVDVCAGAISNGNVFALGRAITKLTYDSVALAFKHAGDCTLDVWNTLAAKLITVFKVDSFVQAYTEACKSTSRNNRAITLNTVATAYVEVALKEYSDVFAAALSGADSKCKCRGAGYCCNECAERSPDCPF